MTFSSSPATPGLKKPNNVFNMQNTVSNDLNEVQEKYSRYIRCQNEETAKDVDPPCDLTGSDNFRKLSGAYDQLYSSLDNLNNVYDKQVIDGKDNESYENDQEELEEFYKKTRKLRKELDDKLKYIQNQSNLNTAPVYRHQQSRVLINTLLIILLVYLVYIIIFDLM